MAEQLHELVASWSWPTILVVLAVSLVVLGKAADWLVEQAVAISLRSGIPRVIVGATVVSLGTTTPEAAVSVLAAIQGKPGLALGNAVGSIICDTGLILGLACLIARLPIDRRLANRQGWIQFLCGVMLVAACVPWIQPGTVWEKGGTLPQYAGWIFLALLAVYIIWSIRMAHSTTTETETEEAETSAESLAWVYGKLFIAIGIVLVASSILIATATELAERLQVPPSIIAATLVAFGTSLPELIIVLTATLKGHGGLAVGNVIGADILNVLFVAGAAAAVTPAGLHAEPHFFHMQFPAMLLVLLVFRIGIWRAGDGFLTRRFGVILLATYLAVTIASYWHP